MRAVRPKALFIPFGLVKKSAGTRCGRPRRRSRRPVTSPSDATRHRADWILVMGTASAASRRGAGPISYRGAISRRPTRAEKGTGESHLWVGHQHHSRARAAPISCTLRARLPGCGSESTSARAASYRGRDRSHAAASKSPPPITDRQARRASPDILDRARARRPSCRGQRARAPSPRSSRPDGRPADPCVGRRRTTAPAPRTRRRLEIVANEANTLGLLERASVERVAPLGPV